MIRLSYTGFLKTCPKLRICSFQLYLFKPSPFAKSWLSVNRQIFDDVIACDLWFRPPQSKILATPINWRLPENFFEDLFFLENTCGCVLGPWPWPRAFQSLALRGSVLGKAVLGLGLGCFLCFWPWPWPRALCPRLHVCCLLQIALLATRQILAFWVENL